ncbi:MAG: hypothetical protein WC656_11810 [Sulfurimonas sp.]|jgi:hypothetical protein
MKKIIIKDHNLFTAVHDKFRNVHNSSNPFHISTCKDFYVIRNSYLIGAKCVCIDDISQLDDAFNLFEVGVPFCDDRFPKTFGEEFKMRDEGFYPFNYQQNELIIDLRVPKIYKELQSVTSLPVEELQSVTSLPVEEFQSVTLLPVEELQSVTLNYCPCGCGNSLSGRQKSFSSSCRKRLQRKNDVKK